MASRAHRGHTGQVSLHLPLLTLKLTAVLAYAGGLVGRFLATDPVMQRRAVHAIASPAMLVIWITGLGLAHVTRVPLTELWIAVALVLSTISLLALIYGVARPVAPRRGLLAAGLPMLVTLVLMIYRPHWSILR